MPFFAGTPSLLGLCKCNDGLDVWLPVRNLLAVSRVGGEREKEGGVTSVLGTEGKSLLLTFLTFHRVSGICRVAESVIRIPLANSPHPISFGACAGCQLGILLLEDMRSLCLLLSIVNHFDSNGFPGLAEELGRFQRHRTILRDLDPGWYIESHLRMDAWDQ